MSDSQYIQFSLPELDQDRPRLSEDISFDIPVKVHFKNNPEDEWEDGLFTTNHDLIVNNTIIRDVNILLKTPNSDEPIDMEEEYEKYHFKTMRETLHLQARYLAIQAMAYKDYYENETA